MNEIVDKVLGYILHFQEKAMHMFEGVIGKVVGVVGDVGISKGDLLTGLLMFSLEISLVLIIIIGMVRLVHARKKQKDLALAKELKEKIQEYLPGREQKLKAIIADMVPHDEAWAAKSAAETASYEKGLYSRILKIILRKDMDSAMGINHDVERLGDSYHRIVTHLSEGAVGDVGGGGGGGSSADVEKISELKSIVAKLRKEKQLLQDELEASIKSMDNIVKEYTRIYSGAPNSEGTEHLEKEIALLREKVGVHLGDDVEPAVESEPESTDVVADLSDEVLDLDIDKNEELKELREEIGMDKKS